MAVFAVISVPGGMQHVLGAAVEKAYPGNRNFKVADGHWLVSDLSTAQEVTHRLGVASGMAGMVIVYNISGYFGYAPTSVWEWIQANWGTARSG